MSLNFDAEVVVLFGAVAFESVVSNTFSRLILSHSRYILDTLFVQANQLTGTWPEELCPSCSRCQDNVRYFGIDCEEVTCLARCCRSYSVCFWNDNPPQQGE